MSLFLYYYFWQNLESLSSHVRESVLRNPENFAHGEFGIQEFFAWNPEYSWRKPESR